MSTPSPLPKHQIVSRSIFRRLDQHVVANDLGEVYYAPIDIRFTPDNVLIPDIIFIARDRLHVVGSRAVDAAPDLVIEILSPGTRRRDLTTKRELYARFGVREYWPVDPEKRTVEVLTLVGDGYQPVPVREDGSLQSRVLPDVRITINDVFEGI